MQPGPKPRPIEDRFWEKVHKTSGCWFWEGGKNGAGYGLILCDGVKQLAHRVAWELTKGSIPEGELVLHRCNTTSCVKPDHLKLGTQRDNMQDRLRDGRHHYSGVKLTADDIPEIVRRYAAGEAQKEIAKDYGITSATVSGIIRGKYWSHVTGGMQLPRARKNTGQRCLSGQVVLAIREAYDRGETQKALALEHGVSKALVQQIVTGRAWKHVQ